MTVLIAMSSHSCFLESLFPKGSGSLTQGAKGTLVKLESFFGGSETIQIQQGALALGITMTMEMDKRLAENQVSAADRQVLTAAANDELTVQIGALSTSLLLTTDENSIRSLIAKTAGGAMAAGSMKGVGVLAAKKKNGALALTTGEVADFAKYGGWALGSTIGALGGDATANLTSAEKAAIASSTLKQAIANVDIASIGSENFGKFSESVANNAMRDSDNGIGKGATAEDLKIIAAGIVSGSIAGIPKGKLTAEELASTVQATTQGATKGLAGIEGNAAFKLAVVGAVTASAMSALKTQLNLNSSQIVSLSSSVITGSMGELSSVAANLGEVGAIMSALTGEAVNAAASLVDTASIGTLAGNIASSAIAGMTEIAKDFTSSAAQIAGANLVKSTMSGTMAGFANCGVDQSIFSGNIGEITKAATKAISSGGLAGEKASAMAGLLSGTAESLDTAGIKSSDTVGAAMLAITQGVSEGMANLIGQNSDISGMLSNIMKTSIDILSSIGVTSASQLTAMTEKIIKGTSMGLGALTTGLTSTELATNLAAISTSALRSLQLLKSAGFIEASAITGFSDNIAGAMFDGLGIGSSGGVANMSDFQVGFITSMQADYVNLGYSSSAVDSAAIATEITQAKALATQLSSGTLRACYPDFAETLTDTELLAAANVSLASVAAGQEASFLCKRPTNGLCPRARPRVSGKDLVWIFLGPFCEYHAFEPYVPVTIGSCSKIAEPAGEAELTPFYSEATDSVQCIKSGGRCPNLEVSDKIGNANWIEFKPPPPPGSTAPAIIMCVFTPPGKDRASNGGSQGSGEISDIYSNCPATFDLTNADSLYNSKANTSHPGYATYAGIGCLRTAAAECPSFSPAAPAGVTFVKWSTNTNMYQVGSAPISAGNLCILTGDYEALLMTEAATLSTGVVSRQFTSTPEAMATQFSFPTTSGTPSYQCYFDRRVDGIVHSSSMTGDSAQCYATNLGGTAFSFSSSTGAFAWTPPATVGSWEFKIVRKNGSLYGAGVFNVVTYPHLASGNETGLRAVFDSMFANSAVTGPQSNGNSDAFKFWGKGFDGGTFQTIFAAIVNPATSGPSGWGGDMMPWRISGSSDTYRLNLNMGASPAHVDFGAVLKAGAIAQGDSDMMIEGWFRFFNHGGFAGGPSGDRGMMGNVATAAGNNKGIQVYEKQRLGPYDFQRRVEVIVGGRDTYEKRVIASQPVVYYRFDRLLPTGLVPNVVGHMSSTSSSPKNLWAAASPTDYQLSEVSPPVSPRVFPVSNDQYLWTENPSAGVSVVPSTGDDYSKLMPALCPMSWEGMIYVKTGTMGAGLKPVFSAYSDGSTKHGWRIVFDTSGDALRLDLGVGGAAPLSFKSNTTVSRDVWHHFAINCVHTDSAADSVSVAFYLDHVLTDTDVSSLNYSGISYTNVSQVVINSGRVDSASGPYLLIDEPAIYGNKNLSTTEIDSHFYAMEIPSLVSKPISDEWHHIGISYQDNGGSADILGLYMDGQSSGSVTTVSGSLTMNSAATGDTDKFLVGRVPGGNDWSGALGDIRIYNTVTSNVLSGVYANLYVTGPRYFEPPRAFLSSSSNRQPVLWLSASRTNSSAGSALTEWNSIGALSSAYQETAAKRPIRQPGLFSFGIDSDSSGVQFNGTSSFMYGYPMYNPTASNKTIIIAARFNGTTTDGTVFRLTNSTGLANFEVIRRGTSGALDFVYADTTGESSSSCTISGGLAARVKPYIISLKGGSSSITVSIDGLADASHSCGASAPTTFAGYPILYLGAHDSAGSLPAKMDVSDFLLYEEDLTSDQHTDVLSYLRSKLNIYD